MGMTMENSSKKQHKHSLEGSDIQQQKPPFKRKKIGSEIDEIFAGKKRKRPENDEKANTEKPTNVSAANVKSHDKMRISKNGKSKSSNENRFVDPTSQPRKRTTDGPSIYMEEKLGIGKPEAGVMQTNVLTNWYSYNSFAHFGWFQGIRQRYLWYCWIFDFPWF